MADRILVTGANGFVGSALCRFLLGSRYVVRGAVRAHAQCSAIDHSQRRGVEWMILHDQSSADETRRSLQGIGTIIHLAGRAHVMNDPAVNPLHEFRSLNVAWTERLARSAAAEGVRRFIYLSSIKVNGEHSMIPFTEQDPPNPQDPYAISKWEAERALATVSSQTDLETVVIRSPLVYGAGVRGNFLQLLTLLHKGLPLPLASVENRRSMIYRANLVDILARCIDTKVVAGQTYLVSDGEDLATPELIRRLGQTLKSTPSLWPLPLSILRGCGRLVGKQQVVDRLLGSLQVNSSKIMQELNWSPPFSVNQGLAETASWFRDHTAHQA